MIIVNYSHEKFSLVPIIPTIILASCLHVQFIWAICMIAQLPPTIAVAFNLISQKLSFNALKSRSAAKSVLV